MVTPSSDLWECSQLSCCLLAFYPQSNQGSGCTSRINLTGVKFLYKLLIFFSTTPTTCPRGPDIDGLVQKRCNYSVSAMELRFFCIKPSIWGGFYEVPVWSLYTWHTSCSLVSYGPCYIETHLYNDCLMQKRCNPSVIAMELCLYCIKPFMFNNISELALHINWHFKFICKNIYEEYLITCSST